MPTFPGLIRTINVDQRLPGERGSLCIDEIRVLDGRFLMLSQIEGEASVTDPWYAILRGLAPDRFTDERGRQFGSSGSSVQGRRVVVIYEGLLFGPGDEKGDLLAGVHELTWQVSNVLEGIKGPWRWDFAAQSGPLSSSTRAAGRELRLYDLVVRTDDFSVGFMELGSYSPPFIGIRSTYNDFADARDSAGRSHRFLGYERVGQTPILYAKFEGPLPPGGAVTVTIDRIYVTTDRNWAGSIRLP